MGRARRAGAGAGARSAGNRDRERVIAGHEREGGAEERAEEGTEEWWAALVHVLGQPSEVRRRAAWEAVAGTAGVGGARLEWAVVEARVRAAERAAMGFLGPAVTGPAGLVGSVRVSAAGRAVRVWTDAEIANAVARGGEVDLGGQEVELTREVEVKGANKMATIRNGTLRMLSSERKVETLFALKARRGGELRLEGVRVVGTGVCCREGGHVTLVDTQVTDAPMSGIGCFSRGSNVVVQGGCVTGPVGMDGVHCTEGGQVELIEVELADCMQNGVVCQYRGSRVVMQGGRIMGSKEGIGLGCGDGGEVEMRGVEIADCKLSCIDCDWRGSRVIVHGGRITGSKECHGVLCEEGGHAEVRNMVIRDCKQYGLYISTLAHSGCTVSGCGSGSQSGC